MQYGVTSFVLLAVPFFMVAGTLMEVTGMARRMIDMVQEWVGHWTGGLLVAEVVAMYVFSGLSGSKAADIATVGGVMKTPLRDYGYPPTESVAVLAASAAMGETIPPSLMLLVLGSITTPVGRVAVPGRAVAGGDPGAGADRRGDRSQPYPWLFQRAAIPAGSRTAQHAAGDPCVPGAGHRRGRHRRRHCLAHRVGDVRRGLRLRRRACGVSRIGLRSGWVALRDAALTAGMVLFMVAASNLVSQAIVIDGLGRTLAKAFASLHNPTVFLLVTVVVMIVVGFILEGIPAILIAAPILLPIATRVGVDPLQYGIVLTMAVGIGVFLPPSRHRLLRGLRDRRGAGQCDDAAEP